MVRGDSVAESRSSGTRAVSELLPTCSHRGHGWDKQGCTAELADAEEADDLFAQSTQHPPEPFADMAHALSAEDALFATVEQGKLCCRC